MIKLPSQNIWSVSNSSDLFGTLQRAINMDFEERGYATLAKRARSIYDSTSDSSDFQRVTAIQYDPTNLRYIVFTGFSGAVYYVNATTLAVSKIGAGTDGNIPSMDSAGRNDMTYWQGYIYGTSTTSLRRYDLSTGTWSTAQTGSGFTGISNAGYLAVHDGLNYLAVSQDNTVLLLSTAHALIFTLTLPTEYKVTSLDYWNEYILVGTRHTAGKSGKVFLWDGKSAAYNSGYDVGSPRVDSVRQYQNTFAVVNGAGQLLKFNGGGFDQLDAFPIFYKPDAWDNDGDAVLGRVINRGMVVDKDYIYINASPRILLPNGDTAGHIFENYFEGGVWCYDPEAKLHKKYSHTGSLRTTETIATSAVNTTDNIITVATGQPTGTPVIYDSGGSTILGGLVHRKKYYAIYLTSTTIKLASTKANAVAGTAIDLTGTGNNAQSLIWIPNRDFGGSTLGGNGQLVDSGSAIAIAFNGGNAYRNNISQVIFGTRIGTSTIAGVYGLAVGAFGQENRGHFITAKINSANITEHFQNVTLKFSGVKTEEDVIVAKYRFVDRVDELGGIDQALSKTATWVNNQSFTTTADISLAEINDEVAFHSGSGSGYTAHITDISLNGGTYTVTIDERIQNITGGDTVGFVIENWNKLGSITTDDCQSFTNLNGDRYISDGGSRTFSVVGQSKVMEIKVELRGEDVRVEEILINNKPLSAYMV